MRADIRERMRATAEGIAQSSGARAEIRFQDSGDAATVNDERLTARMLPTLTQAAQGRAVPASRLGATDPKKDAASAAPNRSPSFMVDGAALALDYPNGG